MHRVALLIAAGLALSACGDSPRPTTQPRVSLKLSVPDDGGSVRAERVEVRGTVSPADAAVQVAGHEAQVEAGQFTAEVELEPGSNVIDVTASSPGRRPATDAVRVKRDTRVLIPQVAGQPPDQAADAVRAAGLEPKEQRGGTWLDRLLGSDVRVCATEPPGGTLIEKGEAVTLLTAPDC